MMNQAGIAVTVLQAILVQEEGQRVTPAWINGVLFTFDREFQTAIRNSRPAEITLPPIQPPDS